MSKGKILVTGGTGYIGSHAVCQLLSAGYNVVSADNLSNSFEDVNERIVQITGKSFDFHKTDFCNENEVESIFAKHPDISGIIHFAAYKSVGESVQQPLKYYHNNLTSLAVLLKIARQNNVLPFVFSSSCTVYGQPNTLPVDESSPVQQPWSPYGNTKKISEEVLGDFSIANPDFQIIALRYFNPIGAHPSGIIGELPIGIPNNLLPYVTQTAFGIRECLQVFGGDYNTPDGTAIRDYIHVLDLANAHVFALDRILHQKMKSNLEVFNLGTGTGYSVAQIIETFERVNNLKVNHKIVDRRPGDVEKIWANPQLANNELGWKTVYNLDDMLKHAWAWENYYRNSIQKKHNHEV